MDLSPGPVLRRRQVGAKLRSLREAAGKSMDEAAAYLECSTAKVSRIETGRLLARVPDVRSMLDLYGVNGDERDDLLDLVRESRQKGWWNEFPEALVVEGYDVFLGLQDAAATIEEYAPYLMPGLLQTTDYAHEVLAPQADLTEKQIERMVALRVANQRAVLDRPYPPRAHFYIDEGVLTRGARNPTMMRGQIRHLIDIARRGHMTVQLVPFSAGFTLAYGTPFVLFGFADPADPKIVFVEHLLGTQFETKLDVVNRYSWVSDTLRAAALSPSDTLENLAERLD